MEVSLGLWFTWVFALLICCFNLLVGDCLIVGGCVCCVVLFFCFVDVYVMFWVLFVVVYCVCLFVLYA